MLRPSHRVVSLFSSASFGLLSLAGGFLACSDAETPNALYDAGPFVIITDSGVNNGGGELNEACSSNSCANANLLCVPQNNNGQTENICRARCDVDDNTDPCGLRFTCVRVGENLGACLPAGQNNEDCPCDEGFACARINDSNGNPTDVCKTSCNPSQPVGSTGCTDNTRCIAFQGSSTEGVCLD